MAPPKVVTIEDLLRLKVKIVFRPLGISGVHGYISADNTMELDPRSRIPMAKLLLHELIHAMWPLMSEHAVGEQERLLWNAATWREKAALYQRLGRARVWEGEDAIDDADGGEAANRPGLQRRIAGGEDRQNRDAGGAGGGEKGGPAAGGGGEAVEAGDETDRRRGEGEGEGAVDAAGFAAAQEVGRTE